MQGRMEHTKKGYQKGKALCQKCKHFSFGYYCEKYKGDAHFPNKNKICKYYRKMKDWTAEEDEFLLQLVHNGVPAKEISNILNKTLKEINSRYNKIKGDDE